MHNSWAKMVDGSLFGSESLCQWVSVIYIGVLDNCDFLV